MVRARVKRRRRRRKMIWWRRLSCFIVAVVRWSTAAALNDRVARQECALNGEDATGGTCINTNDDAADDGRCALYLAPSTIPGAGLGVFTAREKHRGDPIQSYGDVCIPLIDVLRHSPEERPFAEYYWGGVSLGLREESAYHNGVDVLCPGVDCVVNCHLALDNVEKAVPQYDDGSLTMGYHRTTHAGVGAFTPYYNGISHAKRYIPAGGELFKHYGDDWFEFRHDLFGNIPLTEDYAAVNTLLHDFMTLPALENETIAAMKNTTADARNQLLITILQDLYENLILVLKRRFDARTLNALPDTFQEAHQAYENGDITAVLQPKHVHSLDDLEAHGACLDHMRPGPSTLPNAGHGAFATRPLPAGTVITKSPLFHTPTEDYLYMYQYQQYDSQWYRLKEHVWQLQLLYNYCYAHPESSIVLCPYGGGISYINHAASPDRVNVRIEWATGWDIVHNETLVEQGTVDDLTRNSHPQLAFSYIATRDIAAHEELFMDYGGVWEAAWQEHVLQYSYDDSSLPKYASAHAWNFHMEDMYVRTMQEQEIDPYPSNLQIRCHRKVFVSPALPHAIYHWNDEDFGLACRILDRFVHFSENEQPSSSSMELYTVEIEYVEHHSTADEPDEASDTVVWIQRTDVPRSAIRFFDRPYTTDLHLVTAFRHYIGIPDELFPNQWKNM
jgi:SET domain